MKVKLLFSCSHFRTSHDFLIGEILFTDNNNILTSEFLDKQFVFKVGVSKMETAFKNSSLGYYLFDFPINEEREYDDTRLIQQLHSFAYKVGYWWRFLWFAKDNSSHLGDLFVEVPEKHGCIIFSEFDSYSNSSGTHEQSVFTKDDLLFVSDMVKRYSQYMEGTTTYSLDEYELARPDNELNGAFQSKPKTYPYNQNRRIERAWIFVTFARRTEFLPMKISLYVPLFESLFSSGNIKREVMAKRIANYIQEGSSDVESTMNDAYLFRHKYIHGSELMDYSKLEEQKQLSEKVDNIARKVLTKIFLNDLDIYKEKQSKLYDWFNVLDRR